LMKHHEMFCPLASIIEDGDENLPFRDKVWFRLDLVCLTIGKDSSFCRWHRDYEGLRFAGLLACWHVSLCRSYDLSLARHAKISRVQRHQKVVSLYSERSTLSVYILQKSLFLSHIECSVRAIVITFNHTFFLTCFANISMIYCKSLFNAGSRK
jgi:hypothetical protein